MSNKEEWLGRLWGGGMKRAPMCLCERERERGGNGREKIKGWMNGRHLCVHEKEGWREGVGERGRQRKQRKKGSLNVIFHSVDS